MSNSTTNLDLISTSQANKEITANSLFDAASPAMLYGRRAVATSGLTWGYYGGTVSISGTPTQIANGTVTLTASATNYIEADPADGTVSVNQTGFTTGRTPLYSVVAGASTVTSYTDQRTLGGSTSGTVKSVNTKTPDSSGAVTLSASDVGADAAGAASAAVAAHVAASDPHSQYALESTIGQANGIAGLGSDGKVPAAQLPASATTGGTVTSVGLSTPGVLFSVSGSPVTGAGTLTLTLIAQAVNTVFAGPASGGSGAPTFRGLVAADLPIMGASGTGHAAGAVPDPGSTAGTVRYLREDGTWQVPPGTATGSSASAQTFTASGTFTKPAGCTVVEVVVIGGGGGGAGGYGGAAGSIRTGGSGGGGGAMARARFSAADLPATVAVTVGAGGTAGNGGSSGGGANGGTGGTSSFGSYLSAFGGGGGGAVGAAANTSMIGGSGGGTGSAGVTGSTSAVMGGGPTTSTAAAGIGGGGASNDTAATASRPAEYGGAGGGPSRSAANALAGGTSIYGGAGGGGGGSLWSDNTTVSAPGAGGGVNQWSLSGGGGGAAASGSAGAAGTAGATGNSTAAGAGGGGGACNSAGTGGAGGAGGACGGGGGGGGGGTSTGGSGGVGGRGEVRVYCY
jgi:hypothetical protein